MPEKAVVAALSCLLVLLGACAQKGRPAAETISADVAHPMRRSDLPREADRYNSDLRKEEADGSGAAGSDGSLEVGLGADLCHLDCEGRTCGPDGCGGSCGTCLDTCVAEGEQPKKMPEWCIDGICLMPCCPDCSGSECGNDGCGESCGSCNSPQESCVEGLCVCVPKCDSKECGADGCGGECGQCLQGSSCSELQVCEECGDLPCHHWSMSYGGLGRDIPWAMDVDSEGNLLVVGAIESKLLKFQGTEFEDLPGVNSDFQADVSVAKIAPDGEVLWFRVFGGEDWERGWDVAVGALDDIYVIGHFESAALENLGCALPGPPLGFDIFVVKLDSSGECVWALSFGGDGLDDGDTVKIAEDGSIYMSGLTLSSEISFGGDNLAAPDVEGTYGGGLWLAKLGPEGEHIWSHRFEAVDPAHPQLGITHMVLEKGGGLHLAGTGLGLDFGDGYLPTFGLIDVFVARFDNSGEHLWSQSFGGSSGSGLTGFEVDSTGDMYLLGSFAGTMDLGGTSVTSAGKTDAFLARMGPEGSVAWSTRLGGAQEDYGLGLGLMQDGHVVAAAFYEGPATDFWGSPLPDTIHLDMYMAKVDPAGGEAWSMAVGGDLQESITAVDVSQSNWVYLIGGFTSTAIDLGGDPLFNADPCDDDCFDCFVAKFEG